MLNVWQTISDRKMVKKVSLLLSCFPTVCFLVPHTQINVIIAPHTVLASVLQGNLTCIIQGVSHLWELFSGGMLLFHRYLWQEAERWMCLWVTIFRVGACQVKCDYKKLALRRPSSRKQRDVYEMLCDSCHHLLPAFRFKSWKQWTMYH